MRIVLAGLLLTGCIIEPPDSGSKDPPAGGGGGWGSGWGGSSGSSGMSGAGCHADTDCPTSYLCARTGECLTASAVRAVHTLWTVRGQPANDRTCASAPKLDITFSAGDGDTFGFSPVPCDAGKHTVDRLPTRYRVVTLARAGDYAGGDSGSFDASGDAALDLPY